MGILLRAVVLLAFASLTVGIEVKIEIEGEAGNKVDIAPHMVRAPEKISANPCISQKTCGDCITAHPSCAWCGRKDVNYTSGGKTRCNYAPIIRNECGADDTVNISNTAMVSGGTIHAWIKPRSQIEFRLAVYLVVNQPAVGFRDDAPYNVRLTYYSNCSRNKPTEKTNFCKYPKKGQTVVFYVTAELISCPENRDEWNQTVQFYEVSDNQPANLSLHMICECDCEKPWNEERNSSKCSNGKGTYHCGVCSCHDNRYGKECECEGKTTGDTDYDDDAKACIAPHDTKICSGRGRCHCGICECFNQTSMTGRFCECDACPQSNGQICGGKDHGKCVCGKCECTDEWTGPACDCKKDIESCRSPYNGEICHGFGECKCGRCQCLMKDRHLHSGPYCEDCPMCSKKCDEYKDCVRCIVFLSGPLSWEECLEKCTYPIVYVEKVEAKEKDECHCSSKDDDGCGFEFVYKLNEVSNSIIEVRTDGAKDCP